MTLSVPTGGGDGLFWVPAHLHPELAPGEFRAFLKQHTSGDPTSVDPNESGEAALGRSPSWLARSSSLSGGLGRKKSMLSRQYNPRAGDLVENEMPPVLARRGSSVYGRRNAEQEPTLQDLQTLEELVEGSGIGDDPEQMGALLRRTLSMNVSAGRELPTVPACLPAVLTSSLQNSTIRSHLVRNSTPHLSCPVPAPSYAAQPGQRFAKGHPEREDGSRRCAVVMVRESIPLLQRDGPVSMSPAAVTRRRARAAAQTRRTPVVNHTRKRAGSSWTQASFQTTRPTRH